jgi:tricorn protease
VVLKKGDANPMEPQSDEEKVGKEEKGKEGDKDKEEEKNKDKAKENGKDNEKEKGKEGEKKDKDKVPAVTIDFDGIMQRIVALPIKAANYVQLDAGKAGVLFLAEIVDVPRFGVPALLTVSKFELKTRKTEPFTSGVSTFAVSANGEKSLFRQGPPPSTTWVIAGTAAAPKAGEGALNLGEMEVYADPRAEWDQMYREAWRIQRDFFYDPGLHGLNLSAVEKEYRGYLAGVGGRADLNYLFTEMLGEGWAAGRRLQGGKRALPFCSHLQRRKLVSDAEGAADPAGSGREDRGVSDFSERKRSASAGKCVQFP